MKPKTLVDLLDEHKEEALAAADSFTGYDSMVEWLVGFQNRLSDDYRKLDPERITVIDHGDYQGTRLFVVGTTGYQPSEYWYVATGYGSCSGCDTWEAIRGYGSDPLDAKQKEDIYQLLHDIASGFRRMYSGDEVA